MKRWRHDLSLQHNYSVRRLSMLPGVNTESWLWKRLSSFGYYVECQALGNLSWNNQNKQLAVQCASARSVSFYYYFIVIVTIRYYTQHLSLKIPIFSLVKRKDYSQCLSKCSLLSRIMYWLTLPISYSL